MRVAETLEGAQQPDPLFIAVPLASFRRRECCQSRIPERPAAPPRLGASNPFFRLFHAGRVLLVAKPCVKNAPPQMVGARSGVAVESSLVTGGPR